MSGKSKDKSISDAIWMSPLGPKPAIPRSTVTPEAFLFVVQKPEELAKQVLTFA